MPGIIGRESEISALRTAVGQLSAGRGATVAVAGEAGIGKTALLDVTAELAAGCGADVLRGAGIEIECDRPFGPLVEALGIGPRSADPRRRGIARLLNEVVPPEDALAASVPARRYRAVDAICALVDELTAVRPLALLLDDLHWADEPTLQVVRRLASTTGVPLLVVGGTRPVTTPGAPDLISLLPATAIPLVVTGLPPAATRALLADLVGGPPGPRLLAMAEGAGGNPLLLTEMVGALRDTGHLHANAAHVEVAAEVTTADLAGRIRTQFARLSPNAAGLLRVGAVLGTSFSLDEAARTGGWPLADLLTPLDQLIRSGLLRDAGGRLSFRHDLVRRAVEAELTPTALRALHTAAGRALAETGAPTVRIARHLALGADESDESAVAWLLKAAQEAASRSPVAAVSLLEEALRLVGSDEERRAEIETALVEALGWSGRNAEAEVMARDLLGRIDDVEARVALRRQLALSMFLSNRAPGAAVECGISADESFHLPALRARCLADASLAHMYCGQTSEASRLVGEALALGTEHGSADAVAMAAAVQSRLLAFAGDYDASLVAARDGMAVVAEGGAAEAVRYQLGYFEVLTLLDLDRYPEATAGLHREMSRVERHGLTFALPPVHAAIAAVHYWTGRLEDAEAEASAGITVAEDSGARIGAVWLYGLCALAQLHRGRVQAAAQSIELAHATTATTTPLLGGDVLFLAQCRLAEARRQVELAAQIAVTGLNMCAALSTCAPVRALSFDAVRLSLLTRDGEAAEQALTTIERMLGASSVPSDVAAVAFARGMVKHEPDVVADAARALPDAIHPLMRARIEEEAARSFWEAGRVEEAGEWLVSATATWNRCGATADARRAIDLFAALGIRRPRRSQRATTGWAALTPTEERVVAEIAVGRSNTAAANTLGISRRTVETHLRHIYEKLGIGGRTELAVAALQRGDTETA